MQFQPADQQYRQPRMSIREMGGVRPVEEALDLTDINKKVDGKIKDLLHPPVAKDIYEGLC
jgi:hypothetical protein